MSLQSDCVALLRRHQVEGLTGLSRSTIYRLANQGEFPRPVRLGQRSVAWRESEVRAWIDARQPANDSAPVAVSNKAVS